MQALTAEQLLAYEAGATLDVAGFAMSPGDIVVLREFKMPPGRSEDELDAGGDGDVLVLLELQQDEALLQVSTAAWIGVGDGCTVGVNRTSWSPVFRATGCSCCSFVLHEGADGARSRN